MQVSQKNKRLTSDQRTAVAKKICEMDFELWFKGYNYKAARIVVEESLGFRMSSSVFKSIREEERDGNRLEWFSVRRRPKPSKNTLLKAEEWERLRNAVKSNVHLIQGRSLDEAVAIVSLTLRCNRHTLDGLTSDMHFWNKQKKES
jgi:hypothetical protein